MSNIVDKFCGENMGQATPKKILSMPNLREGTADFNIAMHRNAMESIKGHELNIARTEFHFMTALLTDDGKATDPALVVVDSSRVKEFLNQAKQHYREKDISKWPIVIISSDTQDMEDAKRHRYKAAFDKLNVIGYFPVEDQRLPAFGVAMEATISCLERNVEIGPDAFKRMVKEIKDKDLDQDACLRRINKAVADQKSSPLNRVKLTF